MDFVDVAPKRQKSSFAPQSFSSKDKGKGGSSCHQCKSRRNIDALTYCTNSLDGTKKKRCRKKFCGHCLKKFYKENVSSIDKKTWTCPSCRKTCCCAACRRRKQKDLGLPTEKPVTRADGILASMAASQAALESTSTPAPQSFSRVSPPRESPRTSTAAAPFEDVVIPPVPVLPLPREGLSSPIPSSISAPFDDELSLLPSGDQETTFDPRTRVSSAQVGELLEQHIKDEAQLVEKSEKNPHFSRLYNLALTPIMKKKIEMILFKKDIPKSQKVDCIASLLRKHQDSA